MEVRHLRQLADAIPVAMLVVDRRARVVAANHAAVALFGQGLGLLTRGRFGAALPPGSALVSLLERARAWVEAILDSTPRIVIFTTGFLDPGYRRFIERRLREEFGFEGTPIEISVRVREKRRDRR